MLVDEDEYLLPLSRYIHLNPIRTRLLEKAEISKKCEYLKKLQNDVPVERIILKVANTGNVKTEDLQDRKTKLKDLRQMAMELCYRYSNYKQKDIGAMFGVDYSTVSQNRVRLKVKLKSSRKLKKQYDRILIQIERLANSKI